MSNFLNFAGNSGVTFKNHGTGGGTSFTLDKSASTNSVLLSIGGIIQKPSTDYTVSGTTITTTSSVTSGVEVFSLIIHDAGNAPIIEDNSIVTAKIADNQVTGAKIALGSDAQGDVMYYNGSDWARLAAGTSGHFLKTQGTGANPAWAAAGGGKVLQFVSATDSSEPSRTYSGSFTDTGQSVSITPTASGSKLLIEMTIHLGSSTQSNAGGKFQLYRDSTNLTSSQWGEIITVHDSTLTSGTLRYVDTAPGTATYEYKLYWFSIWGSGTIYLNRDGGNSYDCPTVMTITEFDAT